MNVFISDIVSVGMLMIFVAAAVLLLMVQGELAPNGGLTRRGKWLLSAALGSGVLAFTLKLAVIVLLVQVPEHLLGAWATSTLNAQPRAGLAALHLPDNANSSQYVWQALPATPPIPKNNPQSPEKIALGKQLFFDKNLSYNNEVSCASCHALEPGVGIDGLSTSVGIHQQRGNRNAPTVWNAAYQAVLFWDGRAASLEEQAKGPLLNPLEMGMPSFEAVVERVAAKPEYIAAFAHVFGTKQPISIEQIAAAIAAYERTLVTPDTAYDRFVNGDRHALNQAQLRGMALFESLGCMRCHSGANFSAASALATSEPLRLFPVTLTPDVERYQLNADTGLAAANQAQGVWRVPSLRNVALTAPYFHNGSVDSLQEAVRIMATTQLGLPYQEEANSDKFYWSSEAQTLTHVEQRALSDAEVEDIVAFLQALSSEQLLAQLESASKL